MRASERGLVAVRSSGGVVLLHYPEPGYGQTTVCGRYDSDRYLPETDDLPDDTRECQVCAGTVALRRRGQRDGAVPAPEQRRQRQEAFGQWATRALPDDVQEAIERRAQEIAESFPPFGPQTLADLERLMSGARIQERRPVNQELYDRTAPAWNCVSDPDGPHYLSGGGCLWCGLPDSETGGWA
jgi:hypothetical protein